MQILPDVVRPLVAALWVFIVPGVGLLLLGRRYRVDLRAFLLTVCGSLGWNLVVGGLLSVTGLEFVPSLLVPLLSLPLVVGVIARWRELRRGLEVPFRRDSLWSAEIICPLLLCIASGLFYQRVSPGLLYPVGAIPSAGDSYAYMAMIHRMLDHCSTFGFGIHPFTGILSDNPPGFMFVMGIWYRLAELPLGRVYMVWGPFLIHGLMLNLAFYQLARRFAGPWAALLAVSFGFLLLDDTSWFAFHSRSLQMAMIPALTGLAGFLGRKRTAGTLLTSVACLTVACFYHHLCVLLLPLAGAEVAYTTFRQWRSDGALQRRTLAVFGAASLLMAIPLAQTLLVLREADTGNHVTRQAVHDRSWDQFSRGETGASVLLYPFRDSIFKGVAEINVPLKKRASPFLKYPASGFWKVVPTPLGQLYLVILLTLAFVVRTRKNELGRFEIATAYFYLLPFLALVSGDFLAARAMVFLGVSCSLGSAYVLAVGLARIPPSARIALVALLLVPLWAAAFVVADHVKHKANIDKWQYRSRQRIIDYFDQNATCDDVVAAEGPFSMVIAADSGVLAPYAFANRMLGRLTGRDRELAILLGPDSSERRVAKVLQSSGVTFIVASGKVREKYRSWNDMLEVVLGAGKTAVFRVKTSDPEEPAQPDPVP